MRRVLLFLALSWQLLGCSSIPFQETAAVRVESWDPRLMAERFQGRVPEHARLVNSLVFEYRGNPVSALGYVDVNAKEQTFTVVCMNPMGVKLFELSGDRDGVTTRFIIEAFAERGNAAAAIGEDIRRVYFDLVPSPEAKIEKERYRVVFRQPQGRGTMEYVFAGADGNVVEKNYSEDGSRVWRVSYYEYRERGGKTYPGGIVLKHYRYGYRLVIKLREILA